METLAACRETLAACREPLAACWETLAAGRESLAAGREILAECWEPLAASWETLAACSKTFIPLLFISPQTYRSLKYCAILQMQYFAFPNFTTLFAYLYVFLCSCIRFARLFWLYESFIPYFFLP